MDTTKHREDDIEEGEEGSRIAAHCKKTFIGDTVMDVYDASLKAIHETESNMTGSRNIRVNIVGSFAQGKTTLSRRLLGDFGDLVSNSTDGISISNDINLRNRLFWEKKEINCSPEAKADSSPNSTSSTTHHLKRQAESPVKEFEEISIWDFGGQYVFYATHQIFLSKRAVYLLVFDLSRGLDTPVVDEDYPSETRAKTMKDYLEFWIHSVSAFVGSNNDTEQPIVLLVGTHKDLLKSENYADNYFKRVRECFDRSTLGVHIYPENFAVSLIEQSDETVEQLRSTILKLGRKQNANCTISMKWVYFEQAIMARRGDKVIPFENVLQIDSESRMPIGDTVEIKKCLNFNHEKGNLLYVDEGELAEYVIVDPGFVIDAFKCIITSKRFRKSSAQLCSLWSNLSKNAILEEELLQYVWTEQTNICKHYDVLIGYLKHYRIIAEAQSFNNDWQAKRLGYFIVPSLCRNSDDRHIFSFLDGKPCTVVSLGFQFKSKALVHALYPKIIAGAIGTWPIIKFKGTRLFFENATVYKMNYCHAGLIMKSGSRIELLVICLCTDEEISPEISNYFRGFVELIVGHELRKYQKDEGSSLESVPFSQTVRCGHKDHNSEGSIDSYDLNMLRMVKRQGRKKICCPDHVSHASLSIDKIFQEWFDYKACKRETHVPKIHLTEKEFLMLSKAVGSEWELLGAELGVREVRLQQIKMDNHTTRIRIYKLFLEWNESCRNEANFDVLVKALGAIPPYSVDWDIVNDLIRQKLE